MVKEKILLGGFEFTFSKFKLIDGHDDTLPFIGTILANGKKLAECSNNGWGGEAVLGILNDKLFKEVETAITGLKIEGCKATMPFIADYLAYKTAVKMFEGITMEKYLVFSNGNMRKMIPVNVGTTGNITEIAKTKEGVELIKQVIANEMKKGFLCLNNNIGRFDKYQ